MTARGGRGFFARHLEGVELAVVAVATAGLIALVVVPRPVEPTDVPEPAMDPRVLGRIRATDERMAAVAATTALDPDVRALGSAMRDYGIADAGGDSESRRAARDLVTRATAAALAVGVEPVLTLRAFETEAFLRELRRWEATGDESEDLAELGGGFVTDAQDNGWALGRHVLASDAARRALFKKRWNEVAGVHGGRFDLGLDEQRAFYAFLIKHPPVSAKVPAELRRAYANQARLKKVEDLAAIDPTYPRDLARGVLLYRLGRFPAAMEAFKDHVDRSPDGPFALRARNYLGAALVMARREQPAR